MGIRDWFKRKPQLPDKAWLQEVKESRCFTPDMVELAKKEFQLLFVYDNMQPEHLKNNLLDNAEEKGVGYTQHSFRMWKHDLGKESYPLTFEEKEFLELGKPAFRPIRGHVYKISDPYLFLKLDADKRNTIQFMRKQVPIVIPYRKLWFKDPRILDAIIPKRSSNSFLRQGNKPNTQTSYLEKTGVLRAWCWMYFADQEYWSDLLNAYEHPAVQVYRDDNALIKEFYDFRINECGPPWD